MSASDPSFVENNSSSQHRRKRLKIDVACETCRAKKVRCDGVRPTCGYCSRRLDLRNRCWYSNGNSIRDDGNTSQTADASVAPQLPVTRSPRSHSLAETLHSGTRDEYYPAPDPTMDAPTTARPPVIQEQQGTRHRTTAPSSTTPASLNTTSPSVVDSMTAVVGEGANTHEFFGSSSAGSFTAQIKKAIYTRLGKSSNVSTTDGLPSAAQIPDRGPQISASRDYVNDISYVLPARRQADELVQAYWTYVDPLYPFLAKESWYRTYNAIFTGTPIQTDEHLFVATLNIIFALSTQLLESITAEKREESSDAYFQRAQALAPMQAWGAGSLELVQYMLLSSQYLQSTHQPHQTWMIVGSAIRTAQGLGLHLPETSTRQPHVAYRETLRKVWYGCVLMDRMVSVTHGRPAMISHQIATAVPLLQATPIDTKANETQRSNDLYAFFIHSVQLYEIIHQVYTAFYCTRNERRRCGDSSLDEDAEDVDVAVRLDRSLGKWQKSLPKTLKWEVQDASKGEISKRQTLILHVRYLHAKILLLRPILSRFCLSAPPKSAVESISDTLQARLIEQGALLCVSMAQSIVDVLAKNQGHDNTIGLLPAWWYRIYYVYTAANVLLATRLRPDGFDRHEVAQSWSQAIGLLKSYERLSPSARRCVAALHILSSKMLEAVPGGSGCLSRRRSLAEVTTQEDNISAETRSTANRHDLAAEGFPGLASLPQQSFVDDFAPPPADLGGLDLTEFDFDVNDLSWLNNMQATWEVINE